MDKTRVGILGASWKNLEGSGRVSWKRLGGVLEASWGPTEPKWLPRGVDKRRVRILGVSWRRLEGALEASRRRLESKWFPRSVDRTRVGSWERFGGLLEAF